MDKKNEQGLNRKECIVNVGIDLGTTNTVVSFVNDDDVVETIKFGTKFTIPSAIFFESKSQMYFGDSALKRCRKSSQSIVKLFKRKIGNDKDKYNILFNKSIEETIEENVFVIDTNCFCDDPNILENFNSNETVILPITVTNELGYRAKQDETARAAKIALENLANASEKYKCKIQFEESDLHILPKDFFKATSKNDENDHKVLTVAMKHIEENVTLITSDNLLRGIKAPSCGVNAVSLSDFKLDRLSSKQKNNEKFSITGEQATAFFLRYIRDEVCKILNCDGINAVITVPVNFNNIQVEATKRAAKSAGIRQVCIEKEPVAAAIAYSLDQEDNRKILVYDFGGGTFDVAVVNFNKEKNEFEVLSTDGNPELGGQDITNEFANYIKEVLEDENELSLFEYSDSGIVNESEYYTDLQIIENEAERVKIALSAFEEDTISLSNLYTSDGNGLSKQIKITKDDFEEIVADIVRKPTLCIEQSLKEASLTAEDIDVVILSGGTSLMPLVKEKVQNFFGKLPFSDKDPATLISNGAAIIANNHFSEIKNDESTKKVKEPIRKTKVVSDLGVAASDGSFDCIINNGVLLPAEGTKNYYLQTDGQSTVDIKVYSRKKNNTTTKYARCDYLDGITLENLPSLSMRDTVVVVSFVLTEEYELKVSAEIQNTDGKTIVESKEITISRDSTK